MAKLSSTSETNLEKKFLGVTNTQDSIQSLSLWIIHHKAHCKKIIDVWMKVLKKAKISHRLTLFYLANDVIQNSKRKGAAQFVECFQEVLADAAILLRDDKIKGSVERVLNIWENRSIYSPELIDELKGTLNNAKTQSAAVTKMVAEFKYESTVEKIRLIIKVQKETAQKLSALNNGKFDPANSGILQQFKDRKHGQQFTVDFEEATRCLEAYIAALEKEVQERTELIEVLEQTDIYYETQRGEARIVSNAYKNFGNRVSAQKKRISDLIEKLPSPFPSPCPDAPSPTNSDGEPNFDTSKAEPTVASPKAESIPSPEGTPEDLRLSPSVPQEMPITSFMPQAGGMMTSWLEAFQSGSPATSDVKGQSSSLDNRLMNLMNKMPQPTQAIFLEQKTGDDTPVKDDESSGQGTPVQDEETSKRPQPHASPTVTNKGYSPNRPQYLQSLKQQQSSPRAYPSTNSNNSAENDSEEWSRKADVSSPKKIENLVEPLQPPPKPNFGNFGELLEPSFNNIIVINPTKQPRQDPRLSRAMRSGNDSLPGDDDTELMDMEIEDSEEETHHGSSKRAVENRTKEAPREAVESHEKKDELDDRQHCIPVISADTNSGNFSNNFVQQQSFDRNEFKRGRMRARPPIRARANHKSFPPVNMVPDARSDWNNFEGNQSENNFNVRGRGTVHTVYRQEFKQEFEPDFERNFSNEFQIEQNFHHARSDFSVDHDFHIERDFGDYGYDPSYNGSSYRGGGYVERGFHSVPRAFRPPQRGKHFIQRKPFAGRGHFNNQPF